MIAGKYFEVIDYTSDVKIKAYGKTMKELFENSAKGMFFLISENKEHDLKVRQEISIFAGYKVSYEDMLLLWLEKLLFYHETKKILFFDFRINSLFLDNYDNDKNFCSTPEAGSFLKAEAFGEKINIEKHEILNHIKGPTYHDLSIIRNSERKIFEANIIFDV
ncbi:MAG TPA: archease [Actinobacteria bacterium]|jgi:SHS2 domain-containing protein|nr:archease [Actinomycetota bacterium]